MTRYFFCRWQKGETTEKKLFRFAFADDCGKTAEYRWYEANTFGAAYSDANKYASEIHAHAVTYVDGRGKQLPIPERGGTRTFKWNGKDCCLSKREWEEAHQFAIKVYEDGEWQPYGVATVTPESVNVKLRKEWVLSELLGYKWPSIQGGYHSIIAGFLLLVPMRAIGLGLTASPQA